MLTDLRGEITLDKNLLGHEEDSTKASKLLSILGDDLKNSSQEDLNTFVQLIHPVIAQSAS